MKETLLRSTAKPSPSREMGMRSHALEFSTRWRIPLGKSAAPPHGKRHDRDPVHGTSKLQSTDAFYSKG
ncbi:hypothetical protein RSAG8_01280, partial [Rhizoctonia solani AG-8 WAC10335]